jgi:hypothetical protein
MGGVAVKPTHGSEGAIYARRRVAARAEVGDEEANVRNVGCEGISF